MDYREATPHPLRDHELHLGRSGKSDVKLKFEDFVDVEAAVDFVSRRKKAGKPPVTEQPLIDFSLLVQEWHMYLNDQLGDCTCADQAHGRMVWAAMVGESIAITDQMVAKMYEASGWRPGQPQTDQGWTLQAAAGYLRTTGFLGKPDIEAYAEVSTTNDDAQQIAMELFGGLSTGIECPESALQQFREGRPWVIVPNSPIAGGHAIRKVKSQLRKSGVYVTWGGLAPADEPWEKEYVDELVCEVPANWQEKMPAELVEAGLVDFSKLESLVNSFTS
jgi:hypothetical protein